MSKINRKAVQSNFVGHVFQPLLDLSDYQQGPLLLYGVDFGFKDLLEGKQELEIQRVITNSYRSKLLTDAGLDAYDVKSPLNLAEELQSDRWKRMNDYIRNAKNLTVRESALLIKLLNALGFHRIPEQIFEQVDLSLISKDLEIAHLALVREIAIMVSRIEDETPYDTSVLERIATEAPVSDPFCVRLRALFNIIVYYSKHSFNLKKVLHWVALAHEEVKNTDHCTPYMKAYMYTRLYRTTSFAPYLTKNYNEMEREMDLCEEWARKLFDLASNEREVILAKENLLNVVESKAKGNLASKNFKSAQRYFEEKLALDPFEPHTYLELGEFFYAQKKYEKALYYYRKGTHLGSPYSAMLNFMSGHMSEKLNRPDDAEYYYMNTISIDPKAVSAYERLTVINRDSVKTSWASKNVKELSNEREVVKPQFANCKLDKAPFPHFVADKVFDDFTAAGILGWLKGLDQWRDREQRFYRMQSIQLTDEILPDHLKFLNSESFKKQLQTKIESAFSAEMDSIVNIVLHRYSEGHDAAIHNDYFAKDARAKAFFTHRVVIYFNDGWDESKGGVLGLFGSESEQDLRATIEPRHNTAAGMAMGPHSHHAVSTVEGGVRYSLNISLISKSHGYEGEE